MMFHSEPVLTLGRDVGRRGVPRTAEDAVPASGRVRHFPLDVLEDLSLLRLRRLFVLLIVRPADLALEFRDFWRRCRESLPLQRVRRSYAVHDRRFVVSRNVGHHLATSGRYPVSATHETVDRYNRHILPPLKLYQLLH